MPSITLPKAVARELERKAGEAGVSVSEYLFAMIARGLDPNTGAKWRIDGALELLKQAGEELGRDNLKQASEKVRGACALAVKARALHKKGLRIELHKDLWIRMRLLGSLASKLGSRLN